MSSLAFYLLMPPLEYHHPRNLNALYLLNKQQYIQHFPKIVREIMHAISCILHSPWLSCSSFTTHHFPVVFLEWSFLNNFHALDNSYQTLCYNIHLHCLIWDFDFFLVSFSTKVFDFLRLRLLSVLILNQSFQFLESVKYIIFILNTINPGFPSCIINKSNIIVRAIDRWHLRRSPYICMHKLQF